MNDDAHNQSSGAPAAAAASEPPVAGADSAQTDPSAPAPSPEVEALVAELLQTRAELEKVAARRDEVTRAYSGLLNEQRDFRSRLEREKERVLEAERGKIAVVLLELGDELDRALSGGGAEGPLGQGVRLISDGLRRRLSSMGIERLSLLGKPFDPNLAEAVDLVAVSEPSLDGTVVEEAVPGYKLGERILRPARVRVARFAAPAQAQPTTPPDGGGASEA